MRPFTVALINAAYKLIEQVDIENRYLDGKGRCLSRHPTFRALKEALAPYQKLPAEQDLDAYLRLLPERIGSHATDFGRIYAEIKLAGVPVPVDVYGIIVSAVPLHVLREISDLVEKISAPGEPSDLKSNKGDECEEK